jgi:hypothetical protein
MLFDVMERGGAGGSLHPLEAKRRVEIPKKKPIGFF